MSTTSATRKTFVAAAALSAAIGLSALAGGAPASAQYSALARSKNLTPMGPTASQAP